MLLPISNIELYHTVVFVADKNPPENKKKIIYKIFLMSYNLQLSYCTKMFHKF